MQNIDWNTIWREARKKRKGEGDKDANDFWNRRAPSFADHSKKTTYAPNFIAIIKPQPGWHVLDVGCGAGTMALPLSPLVQSVTAIDFSEVMIELLNEKCAADNITNIDTRVLAWEDDWDKAEIGVHDIAIASRSLVVDDLQAAIIKLASRARHKVFISALVGDGPFDRKIFEAIERPLDRGPDYLCVYNLLYQMGIYADITFVENGAIPKTYPDIDEAVEGYRWMISEMTETEESSLRRYLAKHLTPCNGGLALNYQHPVHWAIISWSTS